MRKFLELWSICFILLFVLAGCRRGDRAGNPSAPVLSYQGQDFRNTSGATTDDTMGSEIDLPQHPHDAVVIVAIGDSITYGQGAWDGGYPKRLESRLLAAGHNVIVLNKGIQGDQSNPMDARFLSSIVGADIVLLMVGINDVINPGDCAEPFNCHTIEHYQSMLDKALVSRVIPVASTITPARIGDDYDWANPYIQLANAQIMASANQRGVAVVDNYQPILSGGGDALYDDRIHFNAYGYEVIAEQWYNVIEQNQLIQQAVEQKK